VLHVVLGGEGEHLYARRREEDAGAVVPAVQPVTQRPLLVDDLGRLDVVLLVGQRRGQGLRLLVPGDVELNQLGGVRSSSERGRWWWTIVRWGALGG
jgi:hypothetical protein